MYPRSNDEIFKFYSYGSKDYKEAISFIIDSAKGRIYNHGFLRFIRSRGTRPVGKNYIVHWHGTNLEPDDLYDKLRAAWWIEDEDLHQFILMKIIERKIRPKWLLYWPIISDVIDYLSLQRVFSRTTGWEEPYSNYYHDMTENRELYDVNTDYTLTTLLQTGKLPMFNKNISLFDKYILYLYYIEDYSMKEISHIIMCPYNRTRSYMSNLIKQVENEYGKTKESSRISETKTR